MTDPILIPFAWPETHAAISEIIRQHSDNPADVRTVALAGVDLRPVHELLDLGCGFGFMTEAVLARVPPDARVIGVDACAGNRKAFLRAVSRTGRTGTFRCLRIGATLPWPAATFDLVVASYSLYFFPEIIPEIARVLRPNGRLLAVTHSEASFHALVRAAELNEVSSPLLKLVSQFSAENGAARLQPHFAEIRKTDYANSLRFGAADQEAFLQYARFKLPLLLSDPTAPGLTAAVVEQRLRQSLVRQGGLDVDKNDAIFWGREPKT